jgi:hypothetical protein
MRLPPAMPFAELAERLVALPSIKGSAEQRLAKTPNALAAFLSNTIPTTSRRSLRRQQ